MGAAGNNCTAEIHQVHERTRSPKLIAEGLCAGHKHQHLQAVRQVCGSERRKHAVHLLLEKR